MYCEVLARANHARDYVRRALGLVRAHARGELGKKRGQLFVGANPRLRANDNAHGL